jgi:hypothetical protein
MKTLGIAVIGGVVALVIFVYWLVCKLWDSL